MSATPGPRLRYLKVQPIRALARAHGRRLGRSFLHALDAALDRKLRQAVKVRDGGRITLNADVVAYLKI